MRPRALLLHGGPGLPDYLDELASLRVVRPESMEVRQLLDFGGAVDSGAARSS